MKLSSPRRNLIVLKRVKKGVRTVYRPTIQRPKELLLPDNANFQDLNLGSPKLAITPANCELMFDAFMKRFPNMTSKEELRRMAELDAFQWWSFNDLTLSETFTKMRQAITDYQNQETQFFGFSCSF